MEDIGEYSDVLDYHEKHYQNHTMMDFQKEAENLAKEYEYEIRLVSSSTVAVLSVQAVLIGLTMFLIFFHIFPDVFYKRNHNDYYIKAGVFFTIIVMAEMTFFFLFLDFYFYHNLSLNNHNDIWSLLLDSLHTCEMFTILGLVLHCLEELSFCCRNRILPTISFITLSAIIPTGFLIARHQLGWMYYTAYIMFMEIALGPFIGGIILNICLLCRIKSPLISLNSEEVGRVKYVLILSCINAINALYKTTFLLIIFEIGHGPVVEDLFFVNVVLREIKYLVMCLLYLASSSERYSRYIYPCVVADVDKEAIQLEYFDG